jgi:O-antigen/teichoic acid export membrane protein
MSSASSPPRPSSALTSRAFAGLSWSAADILLRHGLGFVILVVLARLLPPEAFGTVALLNLFTAVAAVIADGGFSAALVQDQATTRTDESTVFWINAFTGGAVALAVLAAAPLIAGVFPVADLVPLIRVMALTVFIGALDAVPGARLTKRLDFRTVLVCGVAATGLSGAVAIWMAWRGYGVWALAAQLVISTSAATALHWIVTGWRPSLAFSPFSARRLFPFGGFLLASGLLGLSFGRLYMLVIGALFGVRDLGIYSRAEAAAQLPVGAFASIFGRVAFPLFSAARDGAELRAAVQLAVRGAALLNVPIMLGMIAVAEPLVATLLGEPWLGVVPILKVLCLGGVLWPLHVINLTVLMAQGHSNLYFRVEAVRQVLAIAVLVPGAVFGVMGLAWSHVAFTVVAFGVNAHFTKRHLDYGMLAQMRDVLPVVAAALPMLLATRWLGGRLDLPAALELACLVTFGALLFSALVWAGRLAALRALLPARGRSGGSPGARERHELARANHAD